MYPHLSHPKYRPDIDGLRAVAVLAVVAFHAFPSWLKGGFIGVDIFFVISGYLISTIIFENLDRETFSFSEFYARRIKRIFPALLLVLVACYAIGWFVLLANEYKQLGKHIAAGATFVSNIVLWNEAGYFDNSAETKPLLHLWSLGIEEQFYIVWPLLLWLAWIRNFNLLTITILVAACSFYLNIIGVKQDAVATFYSPQTRFWELLCGTLLAWGILYKKSACANIRAKLDFWLSIVLYRENPQSNGRALSNVISLFGTSLLVYGFWHIKKEYSFPGVWVVFPVLGSLLIVFAGPKAWVNRIFLANKVVVWFGLISYPLYLWHWPLLSFARIIEGNVPSREIRIAAVALSVVLAWLTYRFFERPVRLGKNGNIKIFVLSFIFILMGYIGYETYTRDGLKFRYINVMNDSISEAFGYDWEKGFRSGECFLYATNDKSKNFSEICSSVRKENKPLIMMWGDSHAASLYRGFLAKSDELNFDLAQFTASGCPPVLDFYIENRRECSNLNKFVFTEISKLKPDILLLGGYWSMYDASGEGNWEQLDTNKLLITINQIKELGVTNIFLVGHLPVYTVNQADLLKKVHVWDSVKTRTYRNFNSLARVYNEKIKDVANNAQVGFIDPLDILCDETGCLISKETNPVEPFSYDYGHLTTTGSEYVVSRFFDRGYIKFNY